MATYSEHEQRMLDQKSGEEMDRHKATSGYLNLPKRSEQEVRDAAHSRLSEQLRDSLFQIAKDGARQHIVAGIVGRIIQLRKEIREQYEHCESDFYSSLMSDWLQKIEAIQNEVEALK